MRYLAGVPGATFCIHPNGKRMFTYDGMEFMHINLKNAKKNVMNTVFPSNLTKGPARCNSIFAIAYNSSAFIVTLELNIQLQKFFLQTYQVNDNFSLITPVHEHYLGITQPETENYGLANGIVRDNSTGQLYVVVYIDEPQADVTKIVTFFHAVEIFVNESGHISSNLLAKDRRVPGRWLFPVINSGNMYLLNQFEAHRRKAVRIELNDTRKHSEIVWAENDERWPRHGSDYFMPFFPTQMDDNIVYTADVSILPGFVVLSYLDRTKKVWRLAKFPLEVEGAFLTRTYNHLLLETQVQSSNDGRLIFHGSCITPPCREKAYFMIVNLRELIRGETVADNDYNNSLYGSTTGDPPIIGPKGVASICTRTIVERLDGKKQSEILLCDDQRG